MYKNIGKFYIEDDHVVEGSQFVPGLQADQIIYEVVRVINNHILFREDHMTRLKRSLTLVSQETDIVESIEKSLDNLLAGHPNWDKNIKIDIYDGHYRCYFMESFYPEPSQYEQGVATTLLVHDRLNPEVKQLNMDYKAEIEKIKGDTYFEVLLQNHDGYVLEGSRSNLLFVKGQTIFSAPLGEILNGVTFRNVVKMAAEMGYEVTYNHVHIDDLSLMEACFITGTSLGVLPVRSINERVFNHEHPVIVDLINAYKRRHR